MQEFAQKCPNLQTLNLYGCVQLTMVTMNALAQNQDIREINITACPNIIDNLGTFRDDNTDIDVINTDEEDEL